MYLSSSGSLRLIGSENIFGPGHPDQPIWLDNVQCIGTERSIVECRHNGFGVHDCQHFEDAGAICAGTVHCKLSDLVPVCTELEAFYVLYLMVAVRCGLRMQIMHRQHLLDSVQLLQDSSFANQVPPPH